jgi:hypothetical protein
MNFKNVALEMYDDGFEIRSEDGDTTLARFREAFDFSEVDVTIEGNCLTVYDKGGETLMKAEIYKGGQKPGEE